MNIRRLFPSGSDSPPGMRLSSRSFSLTPSNACLFFVLSTPSAFVRKPSFISQSSFHTGLRYHFHVQKLSTKQSTVKTNIVLLNILVLFEAPPNFRQAPLSSDMQILDDVLSRSMLLSIVYRQACVSVW